MTTRRYKFVTPDSQSTYNDVPSEPTKFYQICAFPNPSTDKFEVREIIINGYNEIETYNTLSISEKNRSKLLKTLRENKYRLYATYTLKHIGLPSCNDISLSRSGILNNDSDYSGFASFNSEKTDFNWRGSMP